VKEFAIAGATLRRALRQRSSVFFLVLFPMLMILILGVAFGGSFTPKVGVLQPPSSALAQHLGDGLRAAPGISVQDQTDERALISAVERGQLEAGVILPADPASPVRYVVRPGLQGQQIESIVSSVVDREANRLRAAGFVGAQTGVDAATAQSKVDAMAAVLPPVPVTVTRVGSAPADTGRFGAMASSQLLLFVFLTAMTTSVALIESRRLGVTRRMLATPTSAGTIVRGEALARVSMALLQAAIIMVGSALLFQVNWGDPLGAASLVIAFALVASAVGLLLGTLARSGEMAIGAGLLLGLGMAALGGSMMPLELFSPTLRKVAHLTPHAWAADGFSTLIARGGGVSAILTELGVLVGAAAVLFAAGGWLLRRRLAR
jgi:ABC-2 type transport system permease protein